MCTVTMFRGACAHKRPCAHNVLISLSDVVLIVFNSKRVFSRKGTKKGTKNNLPMRWREKNKTKQSTCTGKQTVMQFQHHGQLPAIDSYCQVVVKQATALCVYAPTGTGNDVADVNWLSL